MAEYGLQVKELYNGNFSKKKDKYCRRYRGNREESTKVKMQIYGNLII
jgi:hypothetical protein